LVEKLSLLNCENSYEVIKTAKYELVNINQFYSGVSTALILNCQVEPIAMYF